MLFVERCQDFHHWLLVIAAQMLCIVCPRHVHTPGATMNRQESSRLKLCHQPLENTRFGFTERLWARIGITAEGSFFSFPLLVPISIQVDSIWVRSKTIVALLDLFPRMRITIQHDPELIILQHICYTALQQHLLTRLSLAAEHLQKKQAAFRADQLSTMLAEQKEHSIHRFRILFPNSNNVDACPIVLERSDTEGTITRGR
mmetsp:Transcript_23298/g.37275  ORF Transcript_23298/g.37275 Transcript_23298/m.37275 type:complete len:202 (+) Transcript_23298:633-1238(+)